LFENFLENLRTVPGMFPKDIIFLLEIIEITALIAEDGD
jgi:hypothetical protein